MKKMMKIIISLVLIAMCLSLSACGGSSVMEADLAQYLSVTYSGYNGNGTARVHFDFSDFEYDIMSRWKEKDKNWDKLGELTAVEMTVTYAADVSENLSNGDVITVRIQLDEQMAKDYGYAFGNLEKKFTVEGLTEPILIDPFDESLLTLSLDGIAPFAYLDVLYTGSRSGPESHITYKADNPFNLKNGDTVTITATMNEKYIQQGYLLTREEMAYTVEGLRSHVTDVSMLSADDVYALQSQFLAYQEEQKSYGLNIYLADGGERNMQPDSIGSCSSLRFRDSGYVVLQDGWVTTAVVILPFHLDVNDVAFRWWGIDYYEEPLYKSFPDMAGYFIVSDLLLDEDGRLIREGSFRYEMSNFYENDQLMQESIVNRFSTAGIYEGIFAK